MIFIFIFLWVFLSETNQNRRKARYRRASKRRRRTRGKAKLVEVLFSQKREALCFFELEQSITAVDSIAGKHDDSNSKRRRERESERGRGWVVLQAFGLEDSKTEEEEDGCGSPVGGRVTETTRGLERGLGLRFGVFFGILSLLVWISVRGLAGFRRVICTGPLRHG